MQQYYAHPQNKFWKILFEILREDYTTDYRKRVAVIQLHGVALWDVIDSCERRGSLDTDIKNEEANNIGDLLAEFPNIEAIFCNGQKSFKNLQRLLGKDFPKPVFVMPSTSPANAGIPYDKKLMEWSKITDFLKV